MARPLYLMGIGSLGDARYAAAAGFSLVGFALDELEEHNEAEEDGAIANAPWMIRAEPELIRQCTLWLSGPRTVGVFQKSLLSPQLATALVEQCGLALLQVPVGTSLEVIAQLPVPVLLVVRPGASLPSQLPARVEGLVLEVQQGKLAELAPFTNALADRYNMPVFLDAQFPRASAATVPSWLESQPELGLVLHPEPEEGLGLNDFSAIDDFLETLNWDM